MPKQIQSLERGLYILEAILFSQRPVSSIEIAGRLGVHKSTISHLSNTLIELGYLEKEPGSARLLPGPKTFRVARTLSTPVEIVAASRPHLERLAAETGETAHIAELRGRNIFFLENRYPEQALRVQTMTGDVEAAHSTALGKALLSGLSDEEIRALYFEAPMEKFTTKTHGDIESLIEDLGAVRTSGLAYDREEQTAGTRCIAAPVRGPWGRPAAAVGISGPAGRITDSEAAHGAAVRRCSGAIESEVISRMLIPVAKRKRNGSPNRNKPMKDFVSNSNITT